jgi:hypothetical protein
MKGKMKILWKSHLSSSRTLQTIKLEELVAFVEDFHFANGRRTK